MQCQTARPARRSTDVLMRSESPSATVLGTRRATPPGGARWLVNASSRIARRVSSSIGMAIESDHHQDVLEVDRRHVAERPPSNRWCCWREPFEPGAKSQYLAAVGLS
mgnify:CR=1 FL=1